MPWGASRRPEEPGRLRNDPFGRLASVEQRCGVCKLAAIALRLWSRLMDPAGSARPHWETDMRFALVTVLLLGGLAACGGPSENAPPPPAAEATPPPAAPAPPPAATPPPGARFDGHYAGSATGTGRRGCTGDHTFDITIANNAVSGTVTMPGRGGATMTSELSGRVGPNGHAVIHIAPQGGAGARGTVIGTFSDGQLTGREGAPCRRQLTASRQ